MRQRAEGAEHTRRRIVQATYDLHNEQGIAETTMKQIAERADVGLGTVYHHFPTYNDAVRACGQYTFELSRPPTEAVLAAAAAPPERLRRLIAALFAFYERCPGIAKARADRHRIPALEEAMTHWDQHYAELVDLALQPEKRSAPLRQIVLGLLDFDTYSQLRRRGLTTEAAVDAMVDVLEVWLAANAGSRTPMDKRKQRRK